MHELVQWLMLTAAALRASTLAAVTGFGGAAVLLPALIIVFGVSIDFDATVFVPRKGEANQAPSTSPACRR